MIRKAATFFVVMLLTCPLRAEALCLLGTLSNVPSVVTFTGSGGGYGAFDPTQYMQAVSFDVNIVTSLGACRYYVTLDAGSSGSASPRKMQRGGDTSLNYNAYTSNVGAPEIFSVSGTYGGSGVISGQFSNIANVNQTRSHSFYWAVAPQQVRTASGGAAFQDTAVNLRLWIDTTGLGVYVNLGVLGDTVPITFRTIVKSDVDLSLVNTGATFDLVDTTQTVDFGDMTTGKALLFDAMVRSNDGYKITVESQNGQVLRHEDYPAVAASVPYGLQVNGAAVDLTSGSPVVAATGTGVTPVTGTRLPTRFTIGSMTGAEPAGDYQDILMVTVSAN